jgi:hypothetical protein
VSTRPRGSGPGWSGRGPVSAVTDHSDDPRYDECDDCKQIGFEVQRCSICGADACPFCDHYCNDDY